MHRVIRALRGRKEMIRYTRRNSVGLCCLGVLLMLRTGEYTVILERNTIRAHDLDHKNSYVPLCSPVLVVACIRFTAVLKLC